MQLLNSLIQNETIAESIVYLYSGYKTRKPIFKKHVPKKRRQKPFRTLRTRGKWKHKKKCNCITSFPEKYNLLCRPNCGVRNYILKYFFVQPIKAVRHIHRRELRLVSLKFPSSKEKEIHFWFFCFTGS